MYNKTKEEEQMKEGLHISFDINDNGIDVAIKGDSKVADAIMEAMADVIVNKRNRKKKED